MDNLEARFYEQARAEQLRSGRFCRHCGEPLSGGHLDRCLVCHPTKAMLDPVFAEHVWAEATRARRAETAFVPWFERLTVQARALLLWQLPIAEHAEIVMRGHVTKATRRTRRWLKRGLRARAMLRR